MSAKRQWWAVWIGPCLTPYSNNNTTFIWRELSSSWPCVKIHVSTRVRGAEKAGPPIDNQTQKYKALLISVIFHFCSSQQKFMCSWSYVTKKKNNGAGRKHKSQITVLLNLVRQRHFYSSKKVTAIFVPNQIGNRSVGKLVGVNCRPQTADRKPQPSFDRGLQSAF